MIKALIAYSFDETIKTLVKLNSVPSELFIVTGCEWKLIKGSTQVGSSVNEPIWDLDFATFDTGNLTTGSYKITLTTTNPEAETDTTTLLVGYNTDTSTVGIFTGIYDQVQAVLNGALGMDSQEFLTFRNKWQSLLGPSFGIDVINYHNEAYYASLQNTLIAYLIVRDVIQSSANRILTAVGGEDGLIKRVETGPVNSEWFNPGSIYADIFKPGGLWDDLAGGICGIAARVGVHIRGCKEIVPIAPQVSYPGDYSYQQQYIRAPQFNHRDV